MTSPMDLSSRLLPRLRTLFVCLLIQGWVFGPAVIFGNALAGPVTPTSATAPSSASLSSSPAAPSSATLSPSPTVPSSASLSPSPTASLSDSLSLEQRIRAIIDSSAYREAVWSVIVRDAMTGKVVVSINPKLIQPASNLKLLTSASFLHLLGPEYRFQTTLHARGSIREGVLNGDLYVFGKGDPSIGTEFADPNPLALFERWKGVLDSLGIRRINGNLIGNEAYFDELPYPWGWSWDDLTFYYAVPIGALSFHENTVDLEVDARGRVGDRPEIRWFPFQTDFVTFVNEQTIIPEGLKYEEGYLRMPGANVIRLTSELPKGYIEKESLAIENPGAYFMDTFYKYLELNGIEVGGVAVTERIDHGSRPFPGLIDAYESRPLSELIREMNQESSNFFSEMILKAVAAKHLGPPNGTPGSTETGLELVMAQLAEMGMDTSRVKLADGSGMASGNLVAADELNRFLLGMMKDPHWDAYRESLAVYGVNGTLKSRPVNADVPLRFRGKTGYISGVRTLSGYLSGSAGQEWVVTLATNQFIGRVSPLDRIHEQILRTLHEQSP